MLADIIGSFVMTMVVFNIWCKLLNRKLDWFNYKTVLIVITTTALIILNYFSWNAFLKFINITICLIFIHKYLFRTNIKYSIISSLFSQSLYFIAESLFVSIFLLAFNKNINYFVDNLFGSIFTNLGVSFFAFIISKINFVSKIYSKLVVYIEKINELTIMFFSIMIIYIYSIFAFNIYYDGDPKMLLILSAGISILAFILVYLYLKTKDDYYKMSDRYNSSLLSLKELEKVLTNYRIDNHENKNQLMTIRNMTKSKKITDFIDTIVNNQLKDDKKIMKETSIIPAGGLRGLVYSKLLLMNSKGIDYELDVASSVRVVDILDFGDETMLDICKVIGIFLDNAIEEVDTIDDKYIVIEMYNEEEIFTISITNTYDNSKDKKDIYKAGISTKGGNHGYGLSLAKKIIKNNSKLETSNEITENEFTQVLNIRK